MKRIVIAGIAGGVIMFVWGFLAWMILPLHTAINNVPDEAAFAEAMQDQNMESGMYFVPGFPADLHKLEGEERKKVEENWMARHKAGPLVYMAYSKEGGQPMPPEMYIGSFLINLISSVLVAMALCAAVKGCCQSYLSRVGFVTMIATFASLTTYAMNWNWFHVPLDHTIEMSLDVIIGWTLVGLVQALIIKPCPKAMAETPIPENAN